jgi:hypothetical protein
MRYNRSVPMRASSMTMAFVLAAICSAGCHLVYPFDLPRSDTPLRDSGPDAPPVDALPDLPGPDLPPATYRNYVLDRMVLPPPGEAATYGHDYNNDGTNDNYFGAILDAIHLVAPSIGLQDAMDRNFHLGQVVLLQRVGATPNWSNALVATLQAYTGKPELCCGSPMSCGADAAAASCYSGSHTFAVAQDSPMDAVLSGFIGSGRLQVGPGDVQALLPLGSFSAKVTLKQAYITGMVDYDRISNGKLMGVISKADIDQQVIPAVAALIDKEMNDSTTLLSTRQNLKTLFDTGPVDGKVTAKELANNPVIKTFLAGDVDVNSDGKKELSVGVGFTAVRCQIAGADAGP